MVQLQFSVAVTRDTCRWFDWLKGVSEYELDMNWISEYQHEIKEMRLAPLPFMSYFTAYVVYVTYLLYWCITYRGLSEAYSKRRK